MLLGCVFSLGATYASVFAHRETEGNLIFISNSWIEVGIL